jgi:hypothetical protein
MAIAHGIVFWRERARITSGYGDFAALYTSGLMVRRGLGSELYNRSEQWRIQQEFASQVSIRKGPLPFIRPPFNALLFLPLSYFSYPVAVAVWSVLNLGFLFAAISVLRRPLGRIYPSWLEFILALGFFPVFLDLHLSQDAMLFCLLMVLVFNNLLIRQDMAAGIYLGLGLFKFNLVLSMALLLGLAGRGRVLRGFLASAASLLIVSVAIAGPRVLISYPAYLLEMNRAEGVGFIHTQSMPNLHGLLSSTFVSASDARMIQCILFLVAVVTIAYTARLWRAHMQEANGVALGYCLSLVVSILISYYAYLYDMTLLVIPVLLLSANFLNQSETGTVTRRLLVGAFLLLLCTPVYGVVFLQLDRAYLMSLVLVLVLIGLVWVMKQFSVTVTSRREISVQPSHR